MTTDHRRPDVATELTANSSSALSTSCESAASPRQGWGSHKTGIRSQQGQGFKA